MYSEGAELTGVYCTVSIVTGRYFLGSSSQDFGANYIIPCIYVHVLFPTQKAIHRHILDTCRAFSLA